MALSFVARLKICVKLKFGKFRSWCAKRLYRLANKLDRRFVDPSAEFPVAEVKKEIVHLETTLVWRSDLPLNNEHVVYTLSEQLAELLRSYLVVKELEPLGKNRLFSASVEIVKENTFVEDFLKSEEV